MFGDRAEAAMQKAEALRFINPKSVRFNRSLGIDLVGFAALLFDMNETLAAGLNELADIERLFQESGYVKTLRASQPLDFLFEEDPVPRTAVDLTVVRGLEYYTGAVFEVELFAANDDGSPLRFGSVGGGGRYDGLVSRFMGQPVPATGFSIGVSRLQAALALLNKDTPQPKIFGPVVVTVFGGDIADYQKMVAELRAANIRAELYLGNPKHALGQQVKYADKRNSPCVITQGTDERAANVVQINDLIAGAGLAEIADREEYLKRKAASLTSVPRGDLVTAVRALLAKHGVGWS